MLEWGIGITDCVKRPTTSAVEVTPAEFRDSAEALVRKGEFKQARVWLERLEDHFGPGPYAAGVRQALQTRAEELATEAKALPMGPFFLADMLGLDTAVHTAEHLRDSYGDRFHVHKKMKELVEAGNLGAKTGKGFYEHGR